MLSNGSSVEAADAVTVAGLTSPSTPSIVSVRVAFSETCTRVSVAGELDLSSADLVGGTFVGAFKHGSVVVDMTGVTFIDAGGLRALLVEPAPGHTLTVVTASPVVRRLLNLTGLSARLGLPDDAR